MDQERARCANRVDDYRRIKPNDISFGSSLSFGTRWRIGVLHAELLGINQSRIEPGDFRAARAR
jgi:hypothetical protein